MDLLPRLRQNYWRLKRVTIDGWLRSEIEKHSVNVSNNKLFLSMMYGCVTYSDTFVAFLQQERKL
jgi:hypothetical protein